MIRRLTVLVVSVGVMLGLAPIPANAAPKGEVVVKTIRNEPTRPYCGTYTVQATNASDTPVRQIRLLMYVWTGGNADDTAPYMRTKKKSWVKWPMYLKPGKTITGDIDLCTNVSLQSNAVDFASFRPEKVRWKWAD